MKLPQLSLRDLFWLLLVVALGCAWWVRGRELAIERGKNEKLTRLLPWQTVKLADCFADYLRGEECRVEWEVSGRSGRLWITPPTGATRETKFDAGPDPRDWKYP